MLRLLILGILLITLSGCGFLAMACDAPGSCDFAKKPSQLHHHGAFPLFPYHRRVR